MDWDKIVEQRFKNKKEKGTLDLLELFNQIDFVYSLQEETKSSNSGDISAAWNSIPLPKISELGWADPTKKGGQITNSDRAELATYLSKIQGDTLETRIQSLQQILEQDLKRDLSVSEVLSFLTFYKTLTTIISNFNPSTSGFLFESLLGVLTGGHQIAAKGAGGGETIADFVYRKGRKGMGAAQYVSLKLLTEKGSPIGGSYVDLLDDLSSKGSMQYVVVLKDLEGERENTQGSLNFYEFTFDRNSFLELSKTSVSGLRNLRLLKDRSLISKGEFDSWNDWLNTIGVRVLSNFPEETKIGTMGLRAPRAIANKMRSQNIQDPKKPPKVSEIPPEFRELFLALKHEYDAKETAPREEESFLTAEESIAELSRKGDKQFWQLLKNYSYGYMNKKQFEVTQENVKAKAGGSFAELRVGRAQVEEALTKMIDDTNKRMFKIFKELGLLSEQLREFFMRDLDSKTGVEAKNTAGRIQFDTNALVASSEKSQKR